MMIRPDRYLFIQLFVGILLSVVDASVFCFGLFSGNFSSPPFNFSTSDVNVISTAGTIMSYFSLPIGVLYDRTSPRMTLVVGAIISGAGWALMILVFERPVTSVAAVAACYCVSQFASSCFETSSIFCNLAAFSLHQGRVVMLQKTFIGLGSSVIACIFTAFFAQGDLKWFFLMLAGLGLGFGLLGAAVLKLPEKGSSWLRVPGINTEPRQVASAYQWPFVFGTVVLAANIVFLFSGDLYSAFRTESSAVQLLFGYGSIALVLAFAGMIALMPSDAALEAAALSAPLLDNRSTTTTTAVVENAAQEKSVVVAVGAEAVNDDADTAVTAVVVSDRNTPAGCTARNHRTIFHNIRYPEVWALWVVAFGAIGAVVMVVNNVPQIYAAAVGPRNMRASTPSVLVSLFGIGSALGRVVIGFASGRWPAWRFLCAAPVINVIALPLFLIPGEVIYLPMLLIGLGSGTSWAAIVLNIKALFQNDGQHYNYLYTAGMVAPLLLNNWLFATTYDAESRAQHQPNLGVCDGAKCIAVPICVGAAVNLIAVAASVWLNRRLDNGALQDAEQEPEM